MSSRQPQLSYKKVKIITIISDVRMVVKKGISLSYSCFPALCKVSCLLIFVHILPFHSVSLESGEIFYHLQDLTQKCPPRSLPWPISLNKACSSLYSLGLALSLIFVFLTLYYDHVPPCLQPYIKNILRDWAALLIYFYTPSTLYTEYMEKALNKYSFNKQGMIERRTKRGQPSKATLKFSLTPSLLASVSKYSKICVVSRPLKMVLL